MKPIIGLLGGIGPESTGHFYLSVIRKFQQQVKPKRNTDFPHFVINSIPAPELTSKLITAQDVRVYSEGLQLLQSAGASYAAIICNTAYSYFNQLQKSVTIPVIHLGAEVGIALRNQKMKQVVFLASPNTIRNGLFTYPDIATVSLTQKELTTLGNLINRFNIGTHSKHDLTTLTQIAHKYYDRGVTLVAACTEVSAMLKQIKGVNFIDTMEILADAVVECARHNAYVFLKKTRSAIHGSGIFTSHAIQKNEMFYTIPTAMRSATAKPRWAKVGKKLWVSDQAVLNFVNHSCDANIELVVKGAQPVLIAKRTIQAGEEITCDYSKTEIGGSKVKCTCRSAMCKGYFLRVD